MHPVSGRQENRVVGEKGMFFKVIRYFKKTLTVAKKKTAMF